MISRELAVALREAGVRWTPATGDRFSLVDPAFESDTFTLSDMTIEAQGPPEARVLGFNGTTEWALDSVEIQGGALVAAGGSTPSPDGRDVRGSPHRR